MLPFALALAEAAYRCSRGLAGVLEAEGATHIATHRANSQAATTFVLDRRAWICFRGTADPEDHRSDLSIGFGRHRGFEGAWSGLREPIADWLLEASEALDTVV